MDCLRHSALTAAGQQQGREMGDELEVALSKTLTLEAARFLPSEAVKTTSTGSRSESVSTASSSSVLSSGRSSPVSSSSATSNLYFNLEDEEEICLDDDAASELIRGFSAFHNDSRGRAPWKGGSLVDDHRATTARSNSASDGHSRCDDSLPLGAHKHFTFPLRPVNGWSALNSPTYSASAPISTTGSRRGSTQAGRPQSGVSVTEAMQGCNVDLIKEPDQIRWTMAIDNNSGTPGMSEEDLPDDAEAPHSNTTDTDEHSEIPPRQRPGQGQTEDICELVLRQAFNVDLQDLTFAGDALESVARCLEELSSVVYSDPSGQPAIPLRSLPSGDQSCIQSEDHSGGPDHSQSGRKRRGKRRANSRTDREQGGRGDGDDQHDDQSGGDGSSPARSKKIRVEPPDNRYPCPYRKRNPLKFNVRDYNTCATASYSDFTNLKRHIKLYHRRQARLPYVCFRCGIDQESRDQLMAHVQLPPDEICAVRQEAQNADPEEGITQEVEDLLNERKSKVKIDTWPSLWQALFGCGDEVMSSSFEPPVEWDEVKAEFEGTRDILKNRVQLESVTIKELRPEAQSYVAAHMDQTCWDYIGSVLSASRLQADYQTETHHKRRRSQKSTAAAMSSRDDGLLPPSIQRQILPKAGGAEGGLPVGPNTAVTVSNGSSLSSSWETAISNVSSSNLLSASSSTSLATHGEPLLPAQHRLTSICAPVPGRRVAGFVGDGQTGCGIDNRAGVFSTAADAFPEYIQTVDEGEYALQEGLECLFGYEDYEEHLGDCLGYEEGSAQLDPGYPAVHHRAPL